MSETAVVQRNTHEVPMGLKHAHQRLNEMFFSDISCLLKSSLRGSRRIERCLPPTFSGCELIGCNLIEAQCAS